MENMPRNARQLLEDVDLLTKPATSSLDLEIYIFEQSTEENSSAVPPKQAA